jgi:hypothetical protein
MKAFFAFLLVGLFSISHFACADVLSTFRGDPAIARCDASTKSTSAIQPTRAGCFAVAGSNPPRWFSAACGHIGLTSTGRYLASISFFADSACTPAVPPLSHVTTTGTDNSVTFPSGVDFRSIPQSAFTDSCAAVDGQTATVTSTNTPTPAFQSLYMSYICDDVTLAVLAMPRPYTPIVLAPATPVPYPTYTPKSNAAAIAHGAETLAFFATAFACALVL